MQKSPPDLVPPRARPALPKTLSNTACSPKTPSSPAKTPPSSTVTSPCTKTPTCPTTASKKNWSVQIADAAWRMRRLSRIETTIMTRRYRKRTRTFINKQVPPRTHARGSRGRPATARRIDATAGRDSSANLARYDGHLNRRFHRAVELMMKIRKEDRKLREAENKDATNRDRGVDPSPRSTSPPVWKEAQQDQGVSQDEAPKTPIGFRPANPQNQKPRNEAEPNLTRSETDELRSNQGNTASTSSCIPRRPSCVPCRPSCVAQGSKRPAAFSETPKPRANPKKGESTTPTNRQSAPPTQSTPDRQPNNRQRDARSVSSTVVSAPAGHCPLRRKPVE